MNHQRIYKIKKVPKIVAEYYHKLYPDPEYTFSYYWYLANEIKIWGCFVYKNSILWDYSHQLPMSEMR